MTTSNDASGPGPDVSGAELSATEKSAKPRTRKTTASPKKASPAKPAAKKSVSKKSVKASEISEPAPMEAAAAPASADAEAAAVKKPRARKAAPKKSAAAKDAAAPAESAKSAAAVEAPAEAEKPAKKPAAKKAPAKKPAAKKSAAPKKAAGAVADTPVKEASEAPAVAAEAVTTSASSASAAETAAGSPAVESPASGTSSSDASAADEQGEKPAASRRKRGSRGRGRGSAAKKEAAAQIALEGADLSMALEGQDAKALPASPAHLALEGQAPQAALESGEAQKKSRRRRRGKGGNGNGNGNNGDAARPEGAEGEAKATQPAKEGKEAKEAAAKPARAVAKRKRKMFVNVLAGEQVEVVVSEEGQLREYYVEMLHQAKIKGNIYKGVIHNVDPNLQAAFVSYGAVKNGFLQIDEVHPEYYLTPHEQGKGHKYPLIQKVLKAGQEILVQVVKEPSGTKGAFLTSYLSLPGRYLVLTPGREQIGVSRKVGNDTERGRLREVLNGLNPGEGLGVIVRTVSEGASKTNLQRDLQMLKRIWKDVRKRGSTEESPALIYQELGLAARAVRDYLTDDVTELWVNDKGMADEISEVITMLFPKRKDILQIHDDSNQGLFERFGLAKQITQVQSREVVLPSGGRLVFDQTEALMAIDINSGRTGGKSNFEDMAFKINLEAAQNIPLQLRLRDIGGQIVVDFIEMRDRSHWREVEKAFRNGMKEDRARHDVGKISSFGLLEVVRQRLGSSAISIASEPCPFCKGTGIRRNMEWQALQAMQDIQQLIRQNNEPGKVITYSGGAELILYLLNSKKEWLLDIEQENNIKLELRPGL